MSFDYMIKKLPHSQLIPAHWATSKASTTMTTTDRKVSKPVKS